MLENKTINISSYQTSIDSINSSIQKIRALHLSINGYHNGGLFIVIFFCMMLGPAISLGLSSSYGDVYILSMTAFFMIFLPILSYLSAWIIQHTLEKRFEKMLQSHEVMLAKFHNIHSIDKSLEFLEEIQKLLKKTIIFGRKNGENGRSLLENEIGFCKKLIEDMKNILLLQTEEQKKALESAKSEVEANIGGTIELESVSELQKARLDKQIEQFEELQRILIKI